MPEQNIVTGCVDPDCLMCSGEACNLCGAGCWSKVKNCEHDVIERHEEPEQTEAMTTNTDNPEQTELKPPDRITVRVCRCGVLVAGVNACPHCGAGWAKVKTPPTEYARVSASSAAPVVDRPLYSELIHIAAELARGDGFLPTCAEDIGPRLTRAGVLRTAEDQERRLKDWAYRVRQVANKLSAAAASPASTQEDAEQVPEP